MAKPRPRRDPTHDWEQLQLHITCPKQHLYEQIRPVVMFNQSVPERAAEVDASERTLYRHVAAFQAHGLPGLLPPPSDGTHPHRLPPDIISFVLAMKAEHPPLRPHELATLCYVRTGRRLNLKTIKRILQRHPLPSLSSRRFPPYHEIPDPFERRRAIVRLALEGWTKKSIAAYLQTSRQTVHDTLKRWTTEGLAGLRPRSRAPHRRVRKVTLAILQRIRHHQRNPLRGAWRMHTALKREGIHLSPRTCGRIMAVNRELYPEFKRPAPPPPEPRPMPFEAHYRHHYWTVDIRYLDMHQLGGGNIYCISILENYSRAMLCSAISRIQDTTAFIKVLYRAIEQYGCPTGIVSDSGSVFRSKRVGEIYGALDIQRHFIEKRQAWQSYIETAFNIQRRLADEAEDGFRAARTWDELWQAHAQWMQTYNGEEHWAHRMRRDERHTPSDVLDWVRGRIYPESVLRRVVYAMRFSRRLDRVGYAQFKHWRVYGESGLARQPVVIWFDQDTVTITYDDQSLRRYTAVVDRTNTITAVEPGMALPHSYPSPQLAFWDVIEQDWVWCIPMAVGPRLRQRRTSAIQLMMDIERVA